MVLDTSAAGVPGMKYGVKTCTEPTDPSGIYIQCLYHEFFYGPFRDTNELLSAIVLLDEQSPMWDYDTFRLVLGQDPFPTSYKDLRSVPVEVWDSVVAARG